MDWEQRIHIGHRLENPVLVYLYPCYDNKTAGSFSLLVFWVQGTTLWALQGSHRITGNFGITVALIFVFYYGTKITCSMRTRTD